MGLKKKGNMVYIIDFGLAKRYRKSFKLYLLQSVIHLPKPVGPKPSQTRTSKISKSRIGPGPKNVGPILTGRSLDLAVLESLIICNLSQVRVI